MNNRDWSELICSKCRGEWAYEALKYKKAENAHEFVCANCSGLAERGDGLYCVGDSVRAYPYQFLTPRICVTVAGWISEIEYDSEQYYFDSTEEAEQFVKKLDVPAGKVADIMQVNS